MYEVDSETFEYVYCLSLLFLGELTRSIKCHGSIHVVRQRECIRRVG